MDKIIITDIFGNKVINNITQLFIVVESPYILQKITDRTLYHDSIWKINHNYYNHLNIANNYGPVGDLWFPDEENRNKILLVHKRISTHPIDFIKIDSYMDITIWKPIPPPGFQYLGLVYSKIKPKLDSIFVINQNYIIDYKYKTQIRGRNTSMNEYNLLSNLKISKNTIDTKKLLIKKGWLPHIGKKVKLVQSETPWYELRRLKTPQSHEKVIKTENFYNEKNETKINSNYIVLLLLFLILIITVIHMSI
jgi:hypothetical protein